MNRLPIFLVVIAAAHLSAQTPRFRSGTDAVRVDALVTDGNRPVAGLTAANFELRDNSVPQRITDVSRETLPLNIICVLDVSGSVAGVPLGQLKHGMTALVAALAPGDRAALVSFSERLRMHSGLTGDRATMRAMLNDVEAGGTTALLDAVFAGLALRDADQGRTLLLLFSDGRDTASWLTAVKVLDAARRTDVVIYPVTLRQVPAKPVSVPRDGPQQGRIQLLLDPSTSLLDALADDSGGRVFYADNEAALSRTFVAVLEEFRQRYVLSYTPTGVAGEGWHTIEVKLRGRRGVVKARRGYFASAVKRGAASRARS